MSLFLYYNSMESMAGSFITIRNINPFQLNVPFLYPRKRQKTIGFLTFSEGIEMEHLAKMG